MTELERFTIHENDAGTEAYRNEYVEQVLQFNRDLQADLKDTEDKIQRLQRALAFWLPHVPPNDSSAATRCADDSFLLGGYDGPDEKCAEELGWIKLT